MFKQHDFDSSYFPVSELVSISLIIGFGTAVLDFICSIYYVLTVERSAFSLLYLVSELPSFIIDPIFGALSALAAYPFYKHWALKKNGLKMSVFLNLPKDLN